MAANDNPRDRIPGARSRFRFPYSDTGYAFIGPALSHRHPGWHLCPWRLDGDTDATKTGRSNQSPAVTPGAPPQSPSNK